MKDGSVGAMKFKLLVLVLLLCTACAHLPTDTNSGPDRYQEGAQELILNTKIKDTLDTNGDATDWKFIKIPESGVVTIEIMFLDSESSGELLVLGSNGYLQTSYNTDSSDVLEKLVFKSAEGIYFLKISLTRGKTDYFIKSSLEPTAQAVMPLEGTCLPF